MVLHIFYKCSFDISFFSITNKRLAIRQVIVGLLASFKFFVFINFFNTTN